MIYTTIGSASHFRDEFQQRGRGNQFSYDALGLLFDYFDDMGEDVELDVVAICCEYSEDKPEEIVTYYGIDIDKGENAESLIQQVCDFLEYQTIVVGVTDDGTIVYRQF